MIDAIIFLAFAVLLTCFLFACVGLVNAKRRIDTLDKVVDSAVTPGNYDVNEYMLGMANGLLLAQAIMWDRDVKYLTTPTEERVCPPTAVSETQYVYDRQRGTLVPRV
jgi:hypothetical protein